MVLSDRAIVYLHGFPGGPSELQLFGRPPAALNGTFAPDRANDRPDLDAVAYADDLAGRVQAYADNRPVHLIGFSLGARTALELAGRIGPEVAQIDLISPAGPLDGSDHINAMAGRAIFSMAAARPKLFRLHSAMQGWFARRCPGLLYRALFADGSESMARNAEFRRTMEGILKQCFANGSAGYRREILAYVGPWSSLPTRVKTPTIIWQGGRDSWTPPIMSERLATLLPNAERHLLPELGHYGALQHALHAICDQRQLQIPRSPHDHSR
ncbi:alpha/beta fold hydrolase [Hyphomicrobium sulfonivorans]|uniref:alpha/beta fold hydrolase n=1 Tax=Hyphomicrobium sulfonivorans TaxID=121290 RepID=UPI00156D8F54|nr:alpha/beta hydrolase [Hyphomicrobium sulfonivorans]MBI1648686.1 alpha/beta hydrolase [Hyphomicrobium sulfonivorans]NSL70778.1 hypothetical protein [Hyphomicrobium sulfonivorans]